MNPANTAARSVWLSLELSRGSQTGWDHIIDGGCTRKISDSNSQETIVRLGLNECVR